MHMLHTHSAEHETNKMVQQWMTQGEDAEDDTELDLDDYEVRTWTGCTCHTDACDALARPSHVDAWVGTA